MDYKKFIALIDKGECQTIDYKIECNAFIRGNEKDTAELVKDIIAFSNNGNVLSYLIIGVSNDRTGFRSVENDKLTDDNLQVLCKDSIFPVPKVKLMKCCWSNPIDERHKEKTFVIIQIGPQARQCFRFNRDFIKYDNRYCFRRNEVWVRREATSDIASPEETKRLLEGKEPINQTLLENNIEYKRLSEYDYKKAVKKDLLEFVQNINGTITNETEIVKKYPDKIWNILNINIGGMKLRILVLVTDKCVGKGFIAEICREVSVLHHGIMIISVGNVTEASTEWCPIKIKEPWGWFCTNHQTTMGEIIERLPTSIKEYQWNRSETFCLALEKVESTQALHDKLLKAINTITEKEDIVNYIEKIYKRINENLSRWRETQCATDTEKVLSKKKTIESLKKDEFIDVDKYGNSIMKRNVVLCDMIDRFL